ncbi:nucleolar and spindle-associated protein 1-like [Pomacea canaliculata]|uniref:nucleolar and spindle-associated protein 1-like n=1 Tax=Pomacea canaliculata TaxID=400727 RepID=UPI000D72F7EE|nr:nucleolar and spindle-associated protein 1-like [Pomacea canaliculata]
MDFDSMKYSDLQKLAKKAGIKANMKVEKLVKALKEYYKDDSHYAPSTETTKLKSVEMTDTSNTCTAAVDDDPLEKTQKQDLNRVKKGRRRGCLYQPMVTELVKETLSTESQLSVSEDTDSCTREGRLPQTSSAPSIESSSITETAAEKKRQRTQQSQKSMLGAGASPLELQTMPPLTLSMTTPHKRQRHSTFDVEKPLLGYSVTPEIKQNLGKQDEVTPSTEAMLKSISGDMGSEERRTKLMDAINKKVEISMGNTAPISHIPRFAAFLAKQKQTKTVTPGNKDWEEVHKKAFAKFDSIDVYLEKRRKRTEELSASVKKARGIMQDVQEKVTKLKNRKTSTIGKPEHQPFKPSILSTKDMNLSFESLSESANKKQSSSKIFHPTVVSTKNMSLNFAALKSPVCRTAVKCTPQSSVHSSGTKMVVSVRKSLNTSVKVTGNTPFCFTGNNNTTTSSLNNTTFTKSASKTFNLQASLARPITWKPHTGKLPSLETGYFSSASNMTQSVKKATNRHAEMYKSRRKPCSDTRRGAIIANRMNERNSTLAKRRGVTS